MKKLLSIGVLTFACLWLTPGSSSAGGTFGVFTQTSCWPFSCLSCCGCCGCGKFNGTICVKPYNAFSPACSGSIYCDGIAPIGNPNGAASPLSFGSLPSIGDCCDGATTSLAPHVTPGTFDPQATATPQPAQATAVPGPNTSRLWQNPVPYYGPIQIGYYYPTYNPAANYAQPMAVPYYWNSGR